MSQFEVAAVCAWYGTLRPVLPTKAPNNLPSPPLSTLHPRQGRTVRHASSTVCFNPGAVINAIGTRVTLDGFAPIFDLGIWAEC